MLLLEVLAVLCTAIVLIKTIGAVIGLALSARHIRGVSKPEPVNSRNIQKILLIIPVLREQNVITATLDYLLLHLIIPKVGVQVAIVGSIRERMDRDQFRRRLNSVFIACKGARSQRTIEDLLRGYFDAESIKWVFENRSTFSETDFLECFERQRSTREVVETWISRNSEANQETFTYLECPHIGNRATQLNYCVNNLRRKLGNPDNTVIGIFDADSRPDPFTLIDLAESFRDPNLQCSQQPLHYLHHANRLSSERRNPVLVASAIFQTTWSLVKEYPNLLRFYDHSSLKPSRAYRRSLYLNGHGEFLTLDLYEKIHGFPEGVTTDGIQLGYRLAMLNIPIKPALSFCGDEVPTTLKTLVLQHQRWFAGNLEFFHARSWVKKSGGALSFSAYFDNLLLNASWAFGPIFILFAFGLDLFALDSPASSIALVGLVGACLVFSYILPIGAVWLTGVETRFRFIDWLALPLAIALKSFGPILLICKLLAVRGDRVRFEKVER